MEPVGISVALLLGEVETTFGALAGGADSESSLPLQLNNENDSVMTETIIIKTVKNLLLFITLHLLELIFVIILLPQPTCCARD